MGYFLNKFHIKPLFEAEVDGENTDSNTEDYTADDSSEADTATEPEQTTEDSPSNEDNKDDNAENENTDENQDDNDQQDNTSDETTDYTEDFDNQDGEEGSDEGGNNSDSGSEGGDGEEESEVDELKKKEEELYSNLSPEQLDIKHKELKTQFLEMYDITGSIIDRVTDITVNEDNLEAVEYMSDSLANLRRMLTDYMDSVYATKSYTENSINYNRFLAVLNGINQMLEELLKNKEK